MRVEAPPGTQGPMILLLSGDGDWAPFPKQLGELAAAHGSPVLGLEDAVVSVAAAHAR